jgi:peptide/nickel transport system ATP-binding protein
MSAVEVSGLRVELASSGHDIVDEVSFAIAAGEVLGLVGESGSGKTTVALALLGHSRGGARIARGQARIDGRDILAASAAAVRAARGRTVAYIPQDPGTALNPALRVGVQLEEMLTAHLPQMDAAQRRARLQQMLSEVKLPVEAAVLERYPHQFSGGQQQRIALAMAFACRPRLIVLDEPTTGLDVTTQAHVLDTVRSLCAVHGVAALYVSHDLAVVASLAHRVAVMYAGRVVETGPSEAVFRGPCHPYTRLLLQAVPDPAGRHGLRGIPGHAPSPSRRPAGCAFAPRCAFASEECRREAPPDIPLGGDHSARCRRLAEISLPPAPPPSRVVAAETSTLLSVRSLDAGYGSVTILHEIGFDVRPRECLALLGESGSGKTTLARCVAGLHADHTGTLHFRDVALPRSVRSRSRDVRRAIQYVFQNPFASLNPRKTIGEIIARPLTVFFRLSVREVRTQVAQQLERVALSSAFADRYPDQLSGGERQRVAIARALAAEPELLVCDEITSALDVSVQAAIVELLDGLRRGIGLSLLFVTHNLALIRTIADRVAVMSAGRIVELGDAQAVFEAPRADYTRELLANTPGIERIMPSAAETVSLQAGALPAGACSPRPGAAPHPG